MPQTFTFEQIAQKNRELMSLLGIEAGEQTVEASLLQMMSALGELSGMSYRNKKSISTFEREELEVVVGKLAVSLSMIAECFEIEVGPASLLCIEEEFKRAEENLPSASDSNSKREFSKPDPRQEKSPAAQPYAGGANESVVLSPNSRNNFFSYVEKLGEYPRSTFEQSELKWVVPGVDGSIEELIPNGINRKVTYEEFPEYLRRVEQIRDAQGGPRNVTHGNVAPQIINQAPGYDPDKEAQLFSPSHFSNGLFSPMARPADFMVSEVRPPVALSTQGRQTTSAPSAHAAGMYRARSVADDFERNVSMLKRGDARGPQIAQLGLTFSYPEGEHIVDLIKDGSQIQVTQANVGEFLRLLDQREIGQRHPSERVHRSNSVRQVEVFNEHPNNNYNNFSPSHFSYGLFAPFEKKSTFMVDYENSDKTLPAFLRESSKPQQQQKGLSYVDCIRYNDFVNLERIILSVKEDPNACESYGVTFCIPSKLEPQSSAEEQRSGLRSLIGGSPLQPVKRDQQAIFLALIKPYFRHLF